MVKPKEEFILPEDAPRCGLGRPEINLCAIPRGRPSTIPICAVCQERIVELRRDELQGFPGTIPFGVMKLLWDKKGRGYALEDVATALGLSRSQYVKLKKSYPPPLSRPDALFILRKFLNASRQ